MPNQITSDLASLLGKTIDDLCPQGFHDAEANHCAHFVSHAGGYQFGYLCHLIAGSNLRGVSVRVQEIFPECPQVGKWENLPDTEDDLLVFITARRNVNLAAKTIENVPRKHIGILRGGQVYHYSNGEDKVVRQTPDAVRTRFRATYADQTVDLFFGTLPAITRAAPPARRTRAAGPVFRLKLTRNIYTTTSTIGELTANGKFACYILEDPVRPEKIAGTTAIPAGTYSVVITRSPKFGRDLPLLENVPGFEGIRIHPGNSAADTEGCLLPGRSKATDFVGESRVAFTALFDRLQQAKKNGEDVQIEIVESRPVPAAKSRAKRGPVTASWFRVLADPLSVRSTPDALAKSNITGSVAFGQIVTATGAGAAGGWISVKTGDGADAVTGLVPLSFLEPVPSGGVPVARGKTTLFRVDSEAANLQSVAGTTGPKHILAALPRGQLVARLGGSAKAKWWEVRTVLHDEEITGFMNSSLLAADTGGGTRRQIS